MPSTVARYFAHAHLPPHLAAVSCPIGELAAWLERNLPDGPEKSAGMRKLLEAKDCFVRVAVDAGPELRTTEGIRVSTWSTAPTRDPAGCLCMGRETCDTCCPPLQRRAAVPGLPEAGDQFPEPGMSDPYLQTR